MKAVPQFLDHSIKPAVPGFFDAVIVFDNFAAGQRAATTLAGVLRGLEVAPILRPSYWQFPLLADPRRRAAALSDVKRADLLIVATGDSVEFPHLIKHWIEECVSARRGIALTIIALFGSDKGWSILGRSEDEPTARFDEDYIGCDESACHAEPEAVGFEVD